MSTCTLLGDLHLGLCCWQVHPASKYSLRVFGLKMLSCHNVLSGEDPPFWILLPDCFLLKGGSYSSLPLWLPQCHVLWDSGQWVRWVTHIPSLARLLTVLPGKAALSFVPGCIGAIQNYLGRFLALDGI